MHERTFFTFLLNRALVQDGGGGSSSYEDVFASHYDASKRSQYESGLGPGSSVAHTLELRERLPLLVQDLQVRTFSTRRVFKEIADDVHPRRQCWIRSAKAGSDRCASRRKRQHGELLLTYVARAFLKRVYGRLCLEAQCRMR